MAFSYISLTENFFPIGFRIVLNCVYLLQELEKILDTKNIMLANEPPLGDGKAITIVVRMPDGGRCERRFLKTDKLQVKTLLR